MPEEEKPLQPRWPWLWQRRWWIGLGTLFILVWWLVPPLLYGHSGGGEDAKNAQLKAITDTRAALLAGLIGVGALLTFRLNSRLYRITARTLEVAEQGHITDRFTKAIEQLGSGTVDVRLGGIYALERLAQDSPQRDLSTVVEVLGAFVREHSQRPDSSSPKQGTAVPPKQGTADEAAEKSDASAPVPGAEARPATDVQAALSVLSRLPQQPNVSTRRDFIGAQLAGAQLFGADLSGARLFEANLSGAQLGRANLSDARLSEANLSGAELDGANLSGAKLNGANLSGAKLNDADLSDARLDRADLSGAELHRANLSGARLYGANLHQTQGLTQEQLDVTKGDRQTPLPDRLALPTNWNLVGSPLGKLGGGDI